MDDEEAMAALGARLLKDRALHARDAERRRLARASADAYARVAGRFDSAYAAINAATMTLVAGDRRGAGEQAATLLSRLDVGPDDRSFFNGASRAEALLFDGRRAEAARSLQAAVSRTPHAYADHASTLRQMELICREMALDDA